MLRSYHNYVKKELLNKLKYKNLLNIRSVLGGDIDKWHKFNKVYSIDADLNQKNCGKLYKSKIKRNTEDEYRDIN